MILAEMGDLEMWRALAIVGIAGTVTMSILMGLALKYWKKSLDGWKETIDLLK